MPLLRNPRHEKFCEMVASGVRPSQAYVSVGYSETGACQAASRLLRRVDVRARISEIHTAALESAVERCALSRAWALESLQSVAQRCMQAEPAANSKGEKNGMYTFNAAGATRALELLGRQLGLFTERSETKIAWRGDLAQLSESQLASLTATLEEIAFRDDPDGLAEWHRGDPGLSAKGTVH